ncbi:MAG: hypothetical protein EDM69_04300 [Chlorobiota bacterium]|nr:MAG: hypothetical protein EDM69_04300 [Chlorobiota bacterium]MBV6397769.1 hypothetical protein [Ignavibacteria bacterium]MCE7952900.1 hypothetical protein [Chlorobi bacterium CHB7]RIK49655.1 MAG: hypothetical protein DCC60_03160 [Ignavibacteriota bacterium]
MQGNSNFNQIQTGMSKVTDGNLNFNADKIENGEHSGIVRRKIRCFKADICNSSSARLKNNQTSWTKVV